MKLRPEPSRTRRAWSQEALAQHWGATAEKRQHQPVLTTWLKVAKRRSIEKRATSPTKATKKPVDAKKLADTAPKTPPAARASKRARDGTNFDHVPEDMRNSRWTGLESDHLHTLVKRHKPKADDASIPWKTISKQMENKNSKQCRERWFSIEDPTIDHGPWSGAEDDVVMSLLPAIGRQWSVLAKVVTAWRLKQGLTKRRTDNQVKNRFYKEKRPSPRVTASPELADELVAADCDIGALCAAEEMPTEETLNGFDSFSSILSENDESLTNIMDHDWIAMLHAMPDEQSTTIATGETTEVEAETAKIDIFADETLDTDILDNQRSGCGAFSVHAYEAPSGTRIETKRRMAFTFGLGQHVSASSVLSSINSIVNKPTVAKAVKAPAARARNAKKRQIAEVENSTEAAAEALTILQSSPVPAYRVRLC
jgi:hypothetical protein